MVEPFKFEDFEAKSSVVTRVAPRGRFCLGVGSTASAFAVSAQSRYVGLARSYGSS